MEVKPEAQLNHLDYSSWFDMWHAHVDWNGESQNNWSKRQEFLKVLFVLFEMANKEMMKRNRLYQSFCLIDIDDASQDAMYIHTENPNRENFPLTFEINNEPIKSSFPFIQFVETQGYLWKKLKDGNFLLVYKQGYGRKPFNKQTKATIQNLPNPI